MSDRVRINPEILIWAREAACLTLEEAAHRLSLRGTKKFSAEEKLSKLERGAEDPRESFLEKAAALYRRSPLIFYMPAPPKLTELDAEFRIHAAKEHTLQENFLLDTLVRNITARQSALREAMEDVDIAGTLEFVGSCDTRQTPTEIAAEIRKVLRISEEDQKKAKNPEDLFRTLRNAAEKQGVFVLLAGDLGSHHSDLSGEVFRGFALVDDIAPFIVINDNDDSAGRGFTLLHELAHLWIGKGGISGALGEISPSKVEQFCNAVAAAFLLPIKKEDFSSIVVEADGPLKTAKTISEQWNVSTSACVYKLKELGVIDPLDAGKIFNVLRNRKAKKISNQKKPGGPDFYKVRANRLGKALIDTVNVALQSEAITYTRAGKILGVKPTQVQTLLQRQDAS